MTKFQGAVISEQGQKFAIVVVKCHILQMQSQAREAILNFSGFFPGIPVVPCLKLPCYACGVT